MTPAELRKLADDFCDSVHRTQQTDHLCVALSQAADQIERLREHLKATAQMLRDEGQGGWADVLCEICK